jgi:hypothetical protein
MAPMSPRDAEFRSFLPKSAGIVSLVLTLASSAYSLEAAGQSTFRMLRVSSGTAGAERAGRYVIDEPRTDFYPAEDIATFDSTRRP